MERYCFHCTTQIEESVVEFEHHQYHVSCFLDAFKYNQPDLFEDSNTKCARKKCGVYRPKEVMYLVNGKYYCSPFICPGLDTEESSDVGKDEWLNLPTFNGW